MDVNKDNEDFEEQMVAAALRESKDSPPPSPEQALEQVQADYDKLPELEEYNPEMEKYELVPGTMVLLSAFLQHPSFNNTRGIIVKREQDDGEDEVRGYRYHIKLHGASSGFELRWVKRRNIVVVPTVATLVQPPLPPRSPTPSGGSSRESCVDWNPLASVSPMSAPASSSKTAPASTSATAPDSSTGPASS